MRLMMQGLTDVEFEQRFGTEAACLAALVAARQAAGMPCPRCDNPNSYVYGRRVGVSGIPCASGRLNDTVRPGLC